MNTKKLRVFMKQLMLQNGDLTLVQMSNKIGVSTSYLSQILNEKRIMPKELVTKTCEVFNLSEEDSSELYNLAEYSKKKVDIYFENASDLKKTTTIKYANKLDNLSDDTMKKILDLLDEE